MKDTHQEKMQKDDSGINPIVAGAVGVAIGGVAVALSDKNRRKKMADTVNKFMSDAKNGAQEMQKKAKETAKEVTKKAQEKAENKEAELRDTVEKNAEEIMDIER